MTAERFDTVAIPTPAQIRAAREQAGLTQTQAASIVYSAMRSWQDWEAGKRRMHPAIWALFQLKALGKSEA